MRAIRIDEMIDGLLASGKQIDRNDIMEIQKDTLDFSAFILAPKVAAFAKKHLNLLPNEIRSHVMDTVNILQTFDGNMSKESTGASVYSMWMHKFTRMISGSGKLAEFVEFRNFVINLVTKIVDYKISESE